MKQEHGETCWGDLTCSSEKRKCELAAWPFFNSWPQPAAHKEKNNVFHAESTPPKLSLLHFFSADAYTEGRENCGAQLYQHNFFFVKYGASNIFSVVYLEIFFTTLALFKQKRSTTCEERGWIAHSLTRWI